MTSGLLLLDKPSGPTSHDMVSALRRGAHEKRVGHAGTLDPLATGLLVLCLGAATRLSEYLIEKEKRYLARVRLGQSTNTYDADGQVVSQSEAWPERATVEAALAQFRGAILQKPPAFSAIKRGGQKAYELARRGEMVELEPRPVRILSLELIEWSPSECVLDVHCSAGTYIRSLAHDLGQTLGCGAHLSALRRTLSGHFDVNDAITLDRLQAAFAAGDWQKYLLPMEAALPGWSAVHLSAPEARRIQQGQSVPMQTALGEWARGYNSAGEFFAVLRADAGLHVWKPHKVLVDAGGR